MSKPPKNSSKNTTFTFRPDPDVEKSIKALQAALEKAIPEQIDARGARSRALNEAIRLSLAGDFAAILQAVEGRLEMLSVLQDHLTARSAEQRDKLVQAASDNIRRKPSAH